ncbi:ATP-binding protein [Pantoea sp. RRHST58]|uniref:ATP-binding protein n=1 Tax=Pantoea sp. RRHST58 TaxID=3425183 RepID=UPI003D9FCF71
MRILVLLMLLWCAVSQAKENRELLAHTSFSLSNPGLSQREWQWINSRKTLRYAAWRPVKPPFELISGRQDYSGIVADYLGIITASLHIPVTITFYASKEEALQALKLGTADIIAFAQPVSSFSGLTLSRPWTSSPSVVVSRSKHKQQAGSALRVGIDQDDARLTEKKNDFPAARWIPFKYPRQALEALAFGNLDFYLGSQVTTQYLINLENLQQLDVQIRSNVPPLTFSFAAIREQRTWITIIDKLMAHIPQATHLEIQQRWGGDNLRHSQSPALLSSLEKKWLSQNQRINVVVPENNFPVSYFDRRGQLKGIVADLLALMQQRIGVEFVINRKPYPADALASVKKGESQLMAATSLYSAQQHDLLTSRVLLYSSRVQVVRRQALSAGIPRRLAFLYGQQNEDKLHQYYPGSQLTGVHSWRQGLDKIVKGEADAMVMPLIIGGPLVAEHYDRQLKMTQGQWSEPLRMVMATAKNDYTLASILDKTLMSLPPEELNAIISKRRKPPAPLTRAGIPSAVPAWLPLVTMLPFLGIACWLFWLWRQQHKALQLAHQRAQQQSTFITILSHEMRNSVSAVNGVLELLRQQLPFESTEQLSLQIAHEAAGSLLSLTNDMLDLTRLETNRLILRPEALSLRALLESVAAVYERIACQKKLRLRLLLDTTLNRKVLADPIRLRQILDNLLGNAVKFTHSGDIRLETQCNVISNNRLHLTVYIKDSGEGMDEATCQRLFHPFTQGTQTGNVQGSGMGLYISRSLARMMGGDIQLQSRPGEGSVFSLTLQLIMLDEPDFDIPAAVLPTQLAASKEQKLCILIVDDQPANRFLLLHQLRWLGHEAIECEEASLAGELVQQHHPQLVITDRCMPQQGGFELTQNLKSRWPELIIWGISAEWEAPALEAAAEAGMTACLSKPLTLEILQQHLSCLEQPAPKLWSPAALPSALLNDANLTPFLMMQISALDEALGHIASWQRSGQPELSPTLHRLYGGMVLLGATRIASLCQRPYSQPEELDELIEAAQALRQELSRTTKHSDNPTAK